MGQSGLAQTLRSSPFSLPWVTMASVVNLHVLYSGHFAFSVVSGFSGRISTYLLRGMWLSPRECFSH